MLRSGKTPSSRTKDGHAHGGRTAAQRSLTFDSSQVGKLSSEILPSSRSFARCIAHSPPYRLSWSSLSMSMTSHSKILLSTRPQLIPGMSLSVCICLNCLPSRRAALDCPPGEPVKWFCGEDIAGGGCGGVVREQLGRSASAVRYALFSLMFICEIKLAQGNNVLG